MSDSGTNLPRVEVNDPSLLFTIEEFEKAARFFMSAEDAREWASHCHASPPPDVDRSQKGAISSDLLNVLALVSDSCAARVEKIWGVTPEEGIARRSAIARDYGIVPNE